MKLNERKHDLNMINANIRQLLFEKIVQSHLMLAFGRISFFFQYLIFLTSAESDDVLF